MTPPIVLVGGGKAGALHYRAYRRLARAGRLPLDRLVLIERNGRPGSELAALADGPIPLRTYASLAELHAASSAPRPETAIVDLCLPAAVLVEALLMFWAEGYRKFLVEKPFLVWPHEEADVRRVVETSQVVLVRNYLHSGVHRVVRAVMSAYDLEPLVCVTNFSKDRRADSARGRGAGSGLAAPTVFEIEMPHQVYVGADLVGAPAVLEHVEATDMVTDSGVVARQGCGVMVGRSERDCVFVHYSDLEHPTVVRTLDIICRDRLSVHATYSPICEELRDMSAGVVLAKGDAVLQKRIFTEDDNMTATVSEAYQALSGDTGARLTLDEILGQSWPIRAAIAGDFDGGPPAARPRSDLVQDWFARSFALGLARGVSADLLAMLDQRRRQRFSAVLPGMDPAGTAELPRPQRNRYPAGAAL